MNHSKQLDVKLTNKRGSHLMSDAILNKGTAFDASERERLGLRGLLPPHVLTLDQQARKVLSYMRSLSDDLGKTLYLTGLLDRDTTLFYKVLIDNIKEIAPLIYTPTVGKVCQQFSHIYQRTQGLFLSSEDRGYMLPMVYNWDEDDVKVIVITDGGRILGLGDLGLNGMGIPVGKLALYVAAAGIDPSKVLPVMLDVGTDTESLLEDEFYLGCRHKRLQGEDYYSLLDEAMKALHSRWPKALIQFEDFSSDKAPEVLRRYQDKYLCFNDDIQGTGAVVLAGVLTALRRQGLKPKDIVDQRIVICGAGGSGIGVADQLCEGMNINNAKTPYSNFWLLDSKGLITKARSSFKDGQERYARSEDESDKYPDKMNLVDVVKAVKPTILLGLTATAGTFSEEAIKEMAKHVETPIIFALSNPVSLAECTAEEAYTWTNGKCLFASGSPFDPVTIGGKTYNPSQCNNMFIFPGVGLGATVSGCTEIDSSMFYAAAEKLSLEVDVKDESGLIFPNVDQIRSVSFAVACTVAEKAIADEYATDLDCIRTTQKDSFSVPLDTFIESKIYEPAYGALVYKPKL